jgi:hypothetical protein
MAVFQVSRDCHHASFDIILAFQTLGVAFHKATQGATHFLLFRGVSAEHRGR